MSNGRSWLGFQLVMTALHREPTIGVRGFGPPPLRSEAKAWKQLVTTLLTRPRPPVLDVRGVRFARDVEECLQHPLRAFGSSGSLINNDNADDLQPSILTSFRRVCASPSALSPAHQRYMRNNDPSLFIFAGSNQNMGIYTWLRVIAGTNKRFLASSTTHSA
ncbi:hypothetical protein BJX65DRAFT_304993 [Aspergillus insuetus]